MQDCGGRRVPFDAQRIASPLLVYLLLRLLFNLTGQ